MVDPVTDPKAPDAQDPPLGWADAIVTGLYRRFKGWSQRGFGPDDVTWCEVKADIESLIALSAREAGGTVNRFQNRVVAHLRHVCDEVDDPTDLPERRDRFAEEALELFQSLGGTHAAALALVGYVFGRPAGQPRQEFGGAMTTLAGLAAYAGEDLVVCGEAELARTWDAAVVAKIRRKRANRHGRGPLPGNEADLVSSAVAPAAPDPGAVENGPPVLRATVSVYADQSQTRLEFGDRVRFMPGSDAVLRAIKALEDEYGARWGCPAAREAAPEPATAGREMSQAIFDVLAERRRQVEGEGWSTFHDDGHLNQELAYAAACYAGPIWANRQNKDLGEPPMGWPWSPDWWKPKDTRTNLVRSAALSIAEIERLDRASTSPSQEIA